MKRRDAVLALLALGAAPHAARAQQTGKTARVALVFVTSPVATMDGFEPVHPFARAFLRELRDRGYVEGKNFIFERRSLEGHAERGPEVMAELLRLKTDVIVAPINDVILDAKRATATVPIVMVYSNSPVESGLVASLARPGGNVTGLTIDAGPEMEAKRLEMLKAALPRVKRVAFLGTAADWASKLGQSTRDAARVLGLTLFLAEHRHNDYAGAFRAIEGGRTEAIIASSTPHHFTHRRLIAEFALKNKLPVMSRQHELVEAGCLISYGANIQDNYRRAAIYVDKILKGAKPADLPVEQPVSYELVINMKTAKAFGIKIPQAVLVRTDRVIE
jgi:putative ABC transport system substrate-binding protein